MSMIRVAYRFEHAEDLSPSEQESLAEDMAEAINSRENGIGGYFVVTGGWDWVELEGEENEVEFVLNEHENHVKVTNPDLYNQVSVTSRDYDDWVAHTDDDIDIEMSV
jgi:hypothetical protein